MNTSTVRNVVAAVALISALAVPAAIVTVQAYATHQAAANGATTFELCMPLPAGFSACLRFAGPAVGAR